MDFENFDSSSLRVPFFFFKLFLMVKVVWDNSNVTWYRASF